MLPPGVRAELAGGVISPERKLWEFRLGVELWLLPPAISLAFDSPRPFRQLPHAAASGPTACATLGDAASRRLAAMFGRLRAEPPFIALSLSCSSICKF